MCGFCYFYLDTLQLNAKPTSHLISRDKERNNETEKDDLIFRIKEEIYFYGNFHPAKKIASFTKKLYLRGISFVEFFGNRRGYLSEILSGIPFKRTKS